MSDSDTVMRINGPAVREFGERAIRVLEQGAEQSQAVTDDLAAIEEQGRGKGLEIDKKVWRQAMKLLAGGEDKVRKWREQTEGVTAVLDAYEGGE